MGRPTARWCSSDEPWRGGTVRWHGVAPPAEPGRSPLRVPGRVRLARPGRARGAHVTPPALVTPPPGSGALPAGRLRRRLGTPAQHVRARPDRRSARIPPFGCGPDAHTGAALGMVVQPDHGVRGVGSRPRRAGGDRARGHQHAMAGTAPLHRCTPTGAARWRQPISGPAQQGAARLAVPRRGLRVPRRTGPGRARASHRTGHRRSSSGYRGDRARDRDLARSASGDPTRSRSQFAYTAGADPSSLDRYLRRGDAVVAPWGDVRPPSVEGATG